MQDIFIWFLIFLFPALLIGMVGYYNFVTFRLWKRHKMLEDKGVRVDGTIKKKDEIRTHRSHSFHLHVEYEATLTNGRKGMYLQKGEVEETQYKQARIGDGFSVLYLPEKPEFSRVGGAYSLQKRILMTTVLDVVLVAGFILYMIFA